MTTIVLDRAIQHTDLSTVPTAPTVSAAGASLGGLHDRAAEVDQASLPCRANNPELWFAERPADVEHAKELCAACPVREMCLEGALERGEPWGVWGGELFLAGAVIARKRPRGRPRKDAPVA